MSALESGIVIAAGYLLGSVPFAFLLARSWGGVDVRRTGSGNVGAANVFRSTSIRVALVVMALDAAKGAAAVLVAQGAGGGDRARAAAGCAALVGHIYPVWLGFRGGKGVAPAFGVFALLAPPAAALALLGFVGTVWATRYVSLGSIAATLLLPPLAYLTLAPPATVMGAMIAAALVLYRHKSNVARLHDGTERRIGQRA
jgi:acyl phosphate:glycerol-3-phosphate acyltransferase